MSLTETLSVLFVPCLGFWRRSMAFWLYLASHGCGGSNAVLDLGRNAGSWTMSGYWALVWNSCPRACILAGCFAGRTISGSFLLLVQFCIICLGISQLALRKLKSSCQLSVVQSSLDPGTTLYSSSLRHIALPHHTTTLHQHKYIKINNKNKILVFAVGQGLLVSKKTVLLSCYHGLTCVCWLFFYFPHRSRTIFPVVLVLFPPLFSYYFLQYKYAPSAFLLLLRSFYRLHFSIHHDQPSITVTRNLDVYSNQPSHPF